MATFYAQQSSIDSAYWAAVKLCCDTSGGGGSYFDVPPIPGCELGMAPWVGCPNGQVVPQWVEVACRTIYQDAVALACDKATQEMVQTFADYLVEVATLQAGLDGGMLTYGQYSNMKKSAWNGLMMSYYAAAGRVQAAKDSALVDLQNCILPYCN